MVNPYELGLPKNNAFVDVLNGRERLRLPKGRVLDKLGVGSIIRIPNLEYPEGLKPGSLVVTANLPVPDEQEGMHVALPRIIEPGYYNHSKKEEMLPVLSFEDVWIALVLNHVRLPSYRDVPEYHYHNTIGFSSEAELKETLLRRYRRSRPDWTDNDILSQGVSIRNLELLRKVSLSNYIQ